MKWFGNDYLDFRIVKVIEKNVRQEIFTHYYLKYACYFFGVKFYKTLKKYDYIFEEYHLYTSPDVDSLIDYYKKSKYFSIIIETKEEEMGLS